MAPAWRRRGIAALLVLLLAAALSMAIFSRTDLATAVRDAAAKGLDNIKTVAAMLADRSPGERPSGALASLKQTKRPKLHARALPKVRQPESPLIALVGPPPVPPVEVPTATPPLFAMVSPPSGIVPSGSGGGGPPPDSPPGGSCCGVVVPPSTPETPQTPPDNPPPAVPEPNTWALMLLGFGLIGWAVRRNMPAAAALVAAS
jgi:hypothetical protein